VEVCLVLAPDVNFFLNSRKQGLPCQRSLFFSFLFMLPFTTRNDHDHTMVYNGQEKQKTCPKKTIKGNELSKQYGTAWVNQSAI